jgi:HK97 family phage major capsid protein/HK97 family phage prohead protease
VEPDAQVTTHLLVKSLSVERRTFSGIATTPDLDRQGHTVDPLGASFTNPLPLLWQHDAARPIGTVTFFPPTKEGIAFEAFMPTIDEPGTLKDRIDEAWQSIKNEIVRGVSIGFRVLEDGIERLKNGTLNLRRTEIVELSLVTIPANVHASIRVIKSLGAFAPSPPGVPGSDRSSGAKDAPRMTISEQIAAAEVSRAAKASAMMALMQGSADSGKTLDEAEREQYDTLSVEVKSLDGHLARWRELEALNVQAATPATPAAPARVVPFVQVKSNLPPGTAFVRACMAIGAANGNKMLAAELSKQWKSSTPEVELYLKAAMAPGTSTDPTWAGPLAAVSNVTGEFIELLRPATILGKIPGLRRVPFNVQVPIQNSGGTYKWVGQGAAKPVGKLTFGTVSLPIAKASGIIVFTEELLRLSNPSVEDIVRRDMIAGIAAFLDQQFIDPAVAAVTNVSPASITNGVTPITAASPASPLKDIAALISAMSAANVPLAGVTLIMSQTNAFVLGMQRDAQGNRVFPGMAAGGGTADGITVVTSNTAGTNVIALQPDLVLFADDGGVSIDVSREASLQMDSAPMSPADATVVMTSLWQNNLVGLRAERFIDWVRTVTGSVQYVAGATYQPVSLGGEALEVEGKTRNGKHSAA